MRLKMVFFYLNIKKIPDDTAYDFMLQDVNTFIQKIESMSENINQIYSMSFLNYHQLIMQKKLINIKIPDENKEIVAEIKDRISDLKD